MRSYKDPMVECPYDKNHKMPGPRLQWHLVKCKARAERQKLGLPEFHCRHNYMHVYFTEGELADHEAECQRAAERKQAERLENQEAVNKALETKDESKLKAYRAAQAEDSRMPAANMFLDWNEDTPSDSEISEDEIGTENFKRYKQMSTEDQKIARKRYRQRLLESETSTEESARGGILPDGMRNQRVGKMHGAANFWCDIFAKFTILSASAAMIYLYTKLDVQF